MDIGVRITVAYDCAIEGKLSLGCRDGKGLAVFGVNALWVIESDRVQHGNEFGAGNLGYYLVLSFHRVRVGQNHSVERTDVHDYATFTAFGGSFVNDENGK